MKKMNRLLELRKIFDVQYAEQQREYKALLQREAEIRAEITGLDLRFQKSIEISNSQFQMRSIGADIAWHAWVGRKKTELNIELAQVLSIKERDLTAVREAFGKVSVTRDLCEKMRRDRSRTAQEKSLAQTIENVKFSEPK